jgi:hypothetical protein
MDQNVLISGRDTLLIAIPFVLVLLVCIFRLDHLFAIQKGAAPNRRSPGGLDKSGNQIMRDPDGRLSGLGRSVVAELRGNGANSLDSIAG